MKGIGKKEFSAVESVLRDASDQVLALKDQAEAYKEQRSEKWAESAAGEAYENQIEQLEDVLCTLNDVIDDFINCIEEE